MTDINEEQLKNEIKEEISKIETLRENEEDEIIKFSDFYSIICKRWKLILSVTLIAGILSVIYALSLPNKYKSTASVYLFSNSNYSALNGFFNKFKIESLPDMGEVSLLNTSLKSDSMSEYIINRFGIATNPAIIGDSKVDESEIVFDKVLKQYKRIVLINYDANNNLISISAETFSATTSADIVNAYIEKLDEFSNGPQKTKLKFIENQLAKVSSDLEKSENELKTFQEKHNFYSFDKEYTKALNKLASLEAMKNESELTVGLLKQFASKENEDSKNQKSELMKEIEVNDWKTNAIDTKIKTLEKELKEIPDIMVEYARLKRNLSIKERIFETLNEQHEIAKIAEAEESSQFKIVDRPRISKVKSKPARTGICVFITFIGFMLGICYAFVDELKNKKKN